ncbi:hypothetical protein KY386_00975 [Candidatus Parcubacteria bacterium]|nr:hypothetical protein [Candidatus Parcubacteria bacterium]
MKLPLLRYAAIGLSTAGLGLGVAAAHSVNLDTTGPGSLNRVRIDQSGSVRVDHRNNVAVNNDVNQVAVSGDARVSGNTVGGDAVSGDAVNLSDLSTVISISGFDCGCDLLGGSGGDHDVTIDTTGPDSDNRVRITTATRVRVNLRNTVAVTNEVDQVAVSGDAVVTHNTSAGAADSGAALNDSDATTDVSLTAGSAAVCGCAAANTGDGDHDVTIGTTGPNSNNQVTIDSSSQLSLTSSNDVAVSNDVDQVAVSGDAQVSGNTVGGDAASGDAENSSSLETTISL